MEKIWKIFWKQERTPKEHVSSATICPTLFELCFRADVCRNDHVAGYDDDIMTTLKKAKPTRYSAGPVRYSPVPAQGRLSRRLQTQRGTRMASARRGESTTDDALAVEMNLQSSGHRDSSDDDGEAADFSPRLHKTMMTMTMMVFFSRLSQWDRPNLIHLLLVTTYKIIKIAQILSENPSNCSNQMVTRNQSRG